VYEALSYLEIGVLIAYSRRGAVPPPKMKIVAIHTCIRQHTVYEALS
jgi:hypothetical protein